MLYKISNIHVVNANLLSCPYTAGFSLASLKGFVDFLSYKTGFYFNKFTFVISENTPKTNENIVRDSSLSGINAYKKGVTTSIIHTPAAILQNRYFNFTIDVIVGDEEEELSENIKQILAEKINIAKLQGGIITHPVFADHIEVFPNQTSIEKLVENNLPLSYLITDASDEIDTAQDILDQYASKLAQDKSRYMLISNGYYKIKASDYQRIIDASENIKSYFVEPNLILGKAVYVYEIKNQGLKNYMFSTVNENNLCVIKSIY